ncbi:MAG: hypothetical protein U1U88_001544 [Lawsonella clevelandensis]
MINYEIAEGRYDMSGDALLISQKVCGEEASARRRHNDGGDAHG